MERRHRMKFREFGLGLLATVAIAGMAAAPISATAQGRYNDYQGRRDRDRPGRRNDVRKAEVEDLIVRVERSSNAFRRDYERALRDGYLPGTQRNDNLKQLVQDMDQSLERLRRDF